MEQTIRNFKPNAKASTIKSYMLHLNNALKVLPKEDPFNQNNIKLLDDKLKDKSYLTRRNYYNPIIVYLQATKAEAGTIAKWIENRDKLNEQYIQENKTGKIFESQEDKFIEYDKFMKMIKDLKGYINWAIKSDIPYSNDFHKKYTGYVIFEMLSRFPTRLDMAGMKYLNKKSYNLLTEEEKKHNNYLVKDGAKLFFSYNDYKTSGKYNEITIDVPADLKKILNAYIKFRKIKFQDILFVYRTGGPLSRTAVGELLAEISLEFIGVRLGTTIIRKIIASHKNLNYKKEQEELAKNMMHGVQTQNLIYIKEK